MQFYAKNLNVKIVGSQSDCATPCDSKCSCGRVSPMENDLSDYILLQATLESALN